MIAKGTPLYALIRVDESIDYPEVLACGPSLRFVDARADDFLKTSSTKRRKLLRVRLVVEEILAEDTESRVRTD